MRASYLLARASFVSCTTSATPHLRCRRRTEQHLPLQERWVYTIILPRMTYVDDPCLLHHSQGNPQGRHPKTRKISSLLVAYLAVHLSVLDLLLLSPQRKLKLLPTSQPPPPLLSPRRSVVCLPLQCRYAPGTLLCGPPPPSHPPSTPSQRR